VSAKLPGASLNFLFIFPAQGVAVWFCWKPSQTSWRIEISSEVGGDLWPYFFGSRWTSNDPENNVIDSFPIRVVVGFARSSQGCPPTGCLFSCLCAVVRWWRFMS